MKFIRTVRDDLIAISSVHKIKLGQERERSVLFYGDGATAEAWLGADGPEILTSDLVPVVGFSYITYLPAEDGSPEIIDKKDVFAFYVSSSGSSCAIPVTTDGPRSMWDEDSAVVEPCGRVVNENRAFDSLNDFTEDCRKRRMTATDSVA